MAVDFAQLREEPRLLMQAELKPVQGDRFQSTGFADLGPARYQLHDGTEMLLVESAQSVANRLEATCWDDTNCRLTPEVEGLPYVEVKHKKEHLPNSILEANRIVLENLEPDLRGKVKDSEVAGRVVVEKGAVVESSTIRGPVIIGRGSRISNAYIGPFTSIDQDVVVEHSEVENSIVLRGSRISNLDRRLEESLIGRDAVVERSLSRPLSYKMMLGDCSRVDVI